MIVEPYDAEGLRRILQTRVSKALRSEKVTAGVIENIAALASQQHGDARKAVNLLRRAADLAEEMRQPITLEIVQRANQEIEKRKSN